jgi:transposase-like protein
MEREPKTLQQAILYFGNPDNCLDFLALRRFPDGVMCPRCGSKDVRFLAKRRIWECKSKHAKRQFSVKVNTIFEDSPIGLDKWLTAVWMIANCKNGVSSYEIHRALGVTQKTAWFMLHRIRLALRIGSIAKLGGPGSEVEADETYVGAKASNMHKSRKLEIRQARNQTPDWKYTGGPGSLPNKTAVAGLLDRETRKVRAEVLPNIKRETLQSRILNEVALGSTIYTDDAVAYDSLSKHFTHDVVNHLEGYVRGRVHTNGMENFWSLLKRSLHGSYVAVEPFHLFRYVDEQVFRYNHRATREKPMTDADRFDLALRNIVGKRVTYKELTGKEGETATA